MCKRNGFFAWFIDICTTESVTMCDVVGAGRMRTQCWFICDSCFFFSESVCRRWLSTWFSPLTMKTGPDSRRNGDYFTILETMIMVNREREKKNSGGDNAQWGDKRKAITIGKSFLHFDRLPSAGWCKLSGRRRCCLEPPLLVTLRWSSRAASVWKLFLP